MKKFNLSIPKPCHENWAQMTPAEKGRFCGSCQKTVFDFTNMSDRELAAFFKKPAGSVCGRFHQDQLNREIAVPKKRIPFLRYFFHIAWPALILMLKSCGPKERVTSTGSSSLTLADKRSKSEMDFVTTGVVLSSWEASEEFIPPPPVPDHVALVAAKDENCFVKGEVAAVDFVEPDTLMGDVSLIETLPNDSVVTAQTIEEIDTAYVDMDTVTVVGNSMQRRNATMQCVTPVMVNSVQVNSTTPILGRASVVTAYPNPARRGSILNLKLTEKETLPISMQLLTVGGQRVFHKMLDKPDHSLPITLPLPNNLTSGMYFIQVVYANGVMEKVSVMVSQ